MDLSTTYLGLELAHPLMVGASPICDDLDLVRRAEDAGMAAIVMHSLFEEQILREVATADANQSHGDSFAEALSYGPQPDDFVLGPDGYLEQIRKVKAAVAVPVIGSLNGTSPSGWLQYARLIEEAGADALELNVYSVAHDPGLDAAAVEAQLLEVLGGVLKEVTIPVAVKLGPGYSALANLARRLEELGARGLVLFNRFYQPDLDLEELEVSLTLRLSEPSELLLRLRWLALLSGRVNLSLAASGGVHSGIDALKAVMAGAHGVQIVSALLRGGPERLGQIRGEMTRWLEEKEYESLRQAQGSLSLSRTPNPEAYERGNYVKILQGYARSWA